MPNHTRLSPFITVVGILLLGAAGAQADNLTQVTSLANQAADSTISWSQLGADQTKLSSSFVVNSSAALSTTVGLTGAGLATVVCSAAPPLATNCSWTGTGLPAASEALWTTDGVKGNGPVTLTFGASIVGAGAMIQADAPGQFTASIQAFQGASSLGSFTAISDTAGDAVYIGLKDLTAANVTKVVFSLTACQASCADFALGAIQLNTAVAVTSASLSVSKTHTGTFTQGQTGGEWDVTVNNAPGAGATTGTTTVSDTLPTGYTVSGFSTTAASWSCGGTGTQTATCTSTLAVSAGSSFPPVKIIAIVPANSPVSVTNTGKAFGGGDTTHTTLANAASAADTVTVVQTPATMTATGGTPQSTVVSTPFANNLQVTVTDANNVGVPNVTVTFAAPQIGASATLAGGSTATTNASGVATKAATANTIAGGPYAVIASAGILTPVNFSLTNFPAAPATITITGGNNQSVAPGAPFAPLQIIVKDAFGNPVLAGVNVTFTGPATGPGGTFVNSSTTITLPTVAGGTISAAFTANSFPGSYLVTLASSGISSPPSFSLSNLTSSNVANQVSIYQSGFGRNRATGYWSATLTVTNISASAIPGPVQVLLTNLTPGVTMQNSTGTFNGSPFITVSTGALAPGASATVTMIFANPSNGFINLTPVVYTGAL